MAEVNQAWEVLRSPAARAAYDDSLRAVTSPGAVVPGSPGETVDDQAAVLEPRLGRTGGDEHIEPAHLPWGCLITGLTALVLIFVFTAYAASRADEPIDVQTREPLGVGACVLDLDGTFAEVACTVPGAFEVVERTTFPKACPLRTRAVLLPDNLILICLRPR